MSAQACHDVLDDRVVLDRIHALADPDHGGEMDHRVDPARHPVGVAGVGEVAHGVEAAGAPFITKRKVTLGETDVQVANQSTDSAGFGLTIST